MKKLFYTKLSGMLLYATLLQANPTSPTVVAGDNVGFNAPDAYTLDVSADSDRTIIDWETFSISVDQTTNFILPYSTSAVLNRVTTESVSNILGNLASNGQVYLINPSGIYFGSDAVVNTSAFLASTLDCDNSEFLNAGDMTFLGTENSDIYLINYGTLIATDGDLFLLSYQVLSQGDIYAENGTVGLGAGVEILLSPSNEQKIGIVAHTPLLEGLTGVDVGGYIQATTAELKAQGNLYELAIHHDGWIDAQSDVGAAHVRFVADSGCVSANGLVTALNYGNSGGVIDVMGQDITVDSAANLVTSATYGQGVVNVGQSFGGDNPEFVTAQNVTVNGTIDVSALYYGEGGVAVVWADNALDVSGSIYATGGAYAGDGGTIQAAGLTSYSYTGTHDVSSPTGDPGLFIPITP